jgi:diguanylate cyclase (GGDEF)-like protein
VDVPRSTTLMSVLRPILIAVGLAVALIAVVVMGRGQPQSTPGPRQVSSAMFWVLATLAVVAELRPFALAGRHRTETVYVSLCFTFAITLVWGAGPAIVVQIIAVVAAWATLRAPVWWTAFTIGRFVLALAVADAVFGAIPALLPGVAGSPVATRMDLPAVLIAAAALFVTTYVVLIVGVRVRHGGPWHQVFTRTFWNEALSMGGLLLLAPILAGAPSPWMVVLLLVPLFGVNQMGRLSVEHDRQSRVDSLTGLLNRRALTAEVRDIIARGRRGAHLSLLLLDLDRFKNVNDALGHAVGDRLLVEVARRLTRTVRDLHGADGALVARLGGDEFAVVLPRLADAAAARSAGSALTAAFAQPALMDGLPLDVSASIGVAMFPEHGEDFDTLMRHADVAMYDAKHRGDAVSVYTPGADRNSAARLSLLADLRRALEEPSHADEIALHYQPQVSLRTGELVGVEALLRWHHPEFGLVDPEETIRVAEHSAVMQLLTRRVLDDVTRQLARWNALGHPLRASVNVSVRDLDAPDIVALIAGQLAGTGVAAAQLELEITESALMADPRRVLTTARRLERMGVALSLDDFGTGYSSLQHLRRLPLREIKIDRSFVQTMATDPDDDAIVRSIINLSKALGLRVVAEGVEDERTQRLLAEAGCDLGQGWYHGHPMPAEELTPLLGPSDLALTGR